MPRRVLLLTILALSAGPQALGDGGTLRLSRQQGDLQVSVFTDPAPLRVGPVDVSVLVQGSRSGDVLRSGAVTINCHKMDEPGLSVSGEATTAAATNKLFRAVRLELPAPGRWHFETVVQAAGSVERVAFEAEVLGAAPRWLDLAPWIGWPFLVVLLFLLHLLVSRAPAGRAA